MKHQTSDLILAPSNFILLLWLDHSIPDHSQKPSKNDCHSWVYTIPLACHKSCCTNQNEPCLVFKRAALLGLRRKQANLPEPVHRGIDKSNRATCDSFEERIEPRPCSHFCPEGEQSILYDLARKKDADIAKHRAQYGTGGAGKGAEVHRKILKLD
jgi:hypothetical protein